MSLRLGREREVEKKKESQVANIVDESTIVSSKTQYDSLSKGNVLTCSKSLKDIDVIYEEPKRKKPKAQSKKAHVAGSLAMFE